MNKLLLRLITLSFVFLVSANQLNAQFLNLDTLRQKRIDKIAQTDKYKIWGTSVSFLEVQDTKLSPMIYSGPGIGSNFNSFRTIKQLTHYTNFNLHYFALAGPGAANSYMNGVTLRFNKGVLHDLNNNNWKIGASTNLEGHTRIYASAGNDALSAEILATLNFASSYSLKFNFNDRPFVFDIRAELPLFAYSMRYPEYSVWGVNNLFMPIGKIKALRTQFTFIKPLKYSNENKYSISYEWDFYSFKENDNLHKLVSGTHLITFSYWLKKK